MANSIITKRALGNALKALCIEKPIEKISISEITDYCGLIRQSFYYHFDEKKDLLKWVYDAELFQNKNIPLTMDNYKPRLMTLLESVYDSQKFYKSTITSYDSYLMEYLNRIMYHFFYTLITEYDTDKICDERRKQIWSHHFAGGFTTNIICWIMSGYKEDPDSFAEDLTEMVECLIYTIKYHLEFLENKLK